MKNYKRRLLYEKDKYNFEFGYNRDIIILLTYFSFLRKHNIEPTDIWSTSKLNIRFSHFHKKSVSDTYI